MKKKLYFLTVLMCILCGLSPLKAQETVTIGSGSAGASFSPPIDVYYSYAMSQQIYPANEIEIPVGAVITKIAFQKSNGSSPTRNWSIYMTNSEAGTFSYPEYTASSKAVTSSDKVYNGSFSIPSGNNVWVSFDLTTPLTYEGGDLILTIMDNTGSSGGDLYWSHSFLGRSIHGSKDSQYTEESSYSFNQSYEYTCDIQLTYEGGAPQPLSLTVSTEQENIYSDETVLFTATAKGGTKNYTYSWSPATGLDNASSATPTFTPSATGEYTFTCTVNDGETTATASVTVMVEDASNKPQIIEIGTQTASSSYLPTYTYYGNSLTQQIYTSTEIGINKNLRIKSIAFKDVSGNETPRNIEIYMRNTDINSCTSSSTVMNNNELCFDGYVTFLANDWSTITLQTPFEYEAGKNVLLCIVDKTEQYPNYRYFAVYNSNESSFYMYRDNNKFYATTNTYTPSGYGGIVDQKNCIKLEYEKIVLPLSLTASAEQETIYTDETVQLTATASGGTENYTYSWSPATGLNNASSASPIFTPSTSGTYTFTCTVNDGATTANASVTVNVAERPAAPAIAPVATAEVTGSSSINLSWNAVSGAEWYEIYMIGPSGSNVIYTSETEYAFSGLQADTEYCFIVNAANDGGLSPDSEEVCATTDRIKQYRIRVSTTSHVHYGKYLNINSNTLPGNSGNNTNVNVSTYAESNNQIFTLEDAGNGKNYYLRGADGYYIKCGTNSLGKAWNVYAYSTTEKTPIFFDYIEGSNNFYLRDSDKTGDNYFKVENGNIYCNAPSTNTDVVTWTLEEVVVLEPAVPANLTATALSDSKIILEWEAAENALSYNVYRDGNLIDYTTETTYTAYGLNKNTDYCFKVKATRDTKVSDFSNEACATTTGPTVPDEAAVLVATAATDAATITLTWNEVTKTTSYNIYQDGVLIANTEETTYTVEGLELDATYCYTVKAVNEIGESALASNEACATTYDGSITVTIGEGGSTNNYLPTTAFFSYACTQQIYTKDELGLNACEIGKISFEATSNSSKTRNLEIYMLNTSKSSFSDSYDWVNLSASNKVFDGTFTFTYGWSEITLDTEFSYEGQNILICVIDKTGSYSSNYPFRTNTTTNNQALYACNDGAAYNLSNLSEKTGTPTNKNNRIKLNYKPTPASVGANPEEIVFNDVKGGNYWTEKNNIQTENITLVAKNTTISNISLSDNSFFTIPANIDLSNNIIELSISHKANPTAGNKSANLVVTYAEGVKYIPLSATVYAPVAPDVFELAQEADLSSGSYTDTPIFANLHDDYILPNEVDGNAPDAVYHFTLDKDVLLSATVSGTNGNFAIYRIDDLAGEGPTSTNNYKPNGNESPNLFGYDFNDSNLGDFHMVEYDGNNDNWQIVSNAGPDGSNCLVSYSYTSYGVMKADNYIITNSTYNIADGTKLSLDVACGGAYQGNYDKIIVKVSTDGEAFTPIETIDPQTTEWTNVIVDLGAKFNELGLAYGNYYIALHHYQPSDIFYIFVDNLILSEEADIEGDIYPAGEYYLIAAAEDAFTVNITKTALPAPNAITYTSPANEAMEQVNPALCFELGKHTTEYQVLFGTTNPPAVVKDWTSVTKSEFINSFQTEGLNDNTKYYWQVNARNSSGTTEGEVYSFVTPLNRPTNVVASKTELFSGEETTITWDVTTGATSYNVYVNGSRHNSEAITTTSYTLSDLGYNINPGYEITVTALHDGLGESIYSDAASVKVSSECDLVINVQNANGAILAGAEVSLYGIDQFGNTCQYGPFTSDEEGNVSQRVHLLKDGESYYVNATLAPYSTITGYELVPSYYMYDNGVLYLTVTMNLPAPANFYAENDKIYVGEDLVLHWDEVAGATAYIIYFGALPYEEVTGTTYTIPGLAFNPNGYNVTITTILPEGESIHSDPVIVKVGGTFSLTINVTDNNENPLEGALVTMTLDESGSQTDAIDNDLQTYYELTTNEEGKINIAMPLFKEEYTAYNVEVSKEYYESNKAFVFYYGNDYPDAAFRTNGGTYELNCTLSLTAPENFRANKEYYLEGGTASFTWDAIDASNLLGYNFYYGEFNEETYETNYLKLNDELITRTRFVVSDLEYGYQSYYLTAVYDLGESPKSSAYINVISSGSVRGTVTDANSNPISGATVTISGKDQFEDNQTYNLITNANGEYFSDEIMPSHWEPTYQYVVTVSKADYFTNSYSPVSVEANVETAVPTIVLQAKPSVEFAVTATIATDYNEDEYVEVTWNTIDNTDGYNVYRKDLSNGNVTQLNDYNITWGSHYDNDWMTLANGNYQYGVSAFMKNITTESFEGGAIPTGWSLEADFVTQDWTIYDNTASYIAPRTGNYAIYRNGDHNSGLANHITMAPIDMTSADNATLSFYYVNVNSPSGGDWVNTLKVSAREYGSDSWNELFTTNAEVSSWTEFEIPLEEYAGKMVEVRFSASSNYAQYVAIDDITVTLPSEESKINWSSTLTKQGIEFTGIGNWNVAGNWNTGEVPSEKANVAIVGTAIINSVDTVKVKTLTIAEGGSLTVESGILTVTNGIVNEIASAFVIEDGAQVIQSKNNVKATFRMNVEAPTSWDEDHTKGWQIIASPMKEVKTSSFETDGVDFDLFKYDGSKELEWVNYKGHNEDVVEGYTYLFDFATDFDGWRAIDANGDGYSWGHILTDELHSDYMMGTPEGYDDAGCLFNEAQWYDLDNYEQVTVSPDDYLVAPYMMNISKYSALRFKMRGYSSMTETPEISVLVSEENKNTEDYVPADFTTVGIAPALNAVWEEVIISLEEYAGKNVRIAIRHNVQDSWNTAVLIDKVELANIGFETEFKQGRGYLASYETASTVEFAGVLSNETSYTFNEVNTFNEEDHFANFYLLGNPFAFNMDWENVTAEGLANGYAVVTFDGGYEYAVDGEINVGDGFFVKVTGAEPSLSYYKEQDNGMGMRSRRADKKSYINLVASNRTGSDNVIINFTDNDEEGFAKLENINKDIAEIYVKGEGRRYGILNYENDVEEIELYFDAKRMGEYTISAVTEGEFQSVILVDRTTGVETDLTADSYKFQATSIDSPDRFVIKLNNEAANDNFVYQSGDELIVNAKGMVQIIDVMGRIAYSSDIVNDNHRINISTFNNAAYIVRVMNSNEVKTQKIVIAF